jgi:NAD-dependent DNA ligase
MKAQSHIINIEWNISKDGNIIPTIIIEPVDIGGVTIKRITGNNARYIEENKLGIGAYVEVIRSNDVIPKIENVIEGATVVLPEGQWDDNMVHIVSHNASDDMHIKNIYYFFSTIGAVGLGEKVIEKIYNAGHNTIVKFLQLKIEDIISIDGFKQKSSENIINSIKTYTTNIPLHILMKASNKLGRGMGAERSKDVLEKYPNIMKDYKKYTMPQFIEMLRSIDGWEEKTSSVFAENFKYFIDFYKTIKPYISVDMNVIKKQEGKFSGMKIVVSGFRDAILTQYIEANGGTISSTVSKNTNMLIIKDNSIMGTSKVLNAQKLGVNVCTLDTFKKTHLY